MCLVIILSVVGLSWVGITYGPFAALIAYIGGIAAFLALGSSRINRPVKACANSIGTGIAWIIAVLIVLILFGIVAVPVIACVRWLGAVGAMLPHISWLVILGFLLLFRLPRRKNPRPISGQPKTEHESSKTSETVKPKSEKLTLTTAKESLGLSGRFSSEELKRAYRRKIREYHPDLVATLGKELRELAEAKTKRINEAYELLQSAAVSETPNRHNESAGVAKATTKDSNTASSGTHEPFQKSPIYPGEANELERLKMKIHELDRQIDQIEELVGIGNDERGSVASILEGLVEWEDFVEPGFERQKEQWFKLNEELERLCARKAYLEQQQWSARQT